jgi:hypothetical protein
VGGRKTLVVVVVVVGDQGPAAIRLNVNPVF